MVMYITASEGRLQIEEFLENVRTIGYKDRTVQEIGFVIRKLLSSMDSQTALSEETVISCIHHLKIDRRSVSRYNFFCSSCKKFLNFLYHGDIYFKPALNSELTIDETIQGAHFTDFISQSALNNSLTTKSKKVRAISRFLQALRDTGVNSIEKIKFENISNGFNGLSIEDKYTTLSYLRYLFSINVTNLYQNGVELELIARLLGHSSTETTRIYAVPSLEMMRQAMESGKLSVDETPQWPDDEEEIARLCGIR